MAEYDSKQTDIKDATVTQHFENLDDHHGEVLETRYAGKYLSSRLMEGAVADHFQGLGRWLTVKTFWKAMLFCMVLNWAALNDGVSIYQASHRLILTTK
jgi:hypothetical protein